MEKNQYHSIYSNDNDNLIYHDQNENFPSTTFPPEAAHNVIKHKLKLPKDENNQSNADKIKELEGMVTRLQSEKQALLNENVKYKELKQKYDAGLPEKRSQIQLLKQKMESEADKTKEIERMVTKLQNEKQVLLNKNESFGIKYKELKQNYDEEKRSQIQLLKQKNDDLESEADKTKELERMVTKLQNEKQALLNENVKYKELKQKYDAGLPEKRSQIQLLKQKMESEADKTKEIERMVTKLQNEKQALLNKNESFGIKYKELKQNYDEEKRSQIQLLKQKNDDLESEADKTKELEGMITKLQNEKQALLNENVKYKELKQKYDAGLPEKRSQIQLLKQKMESEADKTKEIERMVTKLQNEKQVLLNKNESFGIKYKELKQNYDEEKRSQIQLLKQKNDDLESEADKTKELERMVTKLKNEKQVLLNENESFGIKYKELRQNYDAGLQEKRSQIQLLRQKNDDLEREADKIKRYQGMVTMLQNEKQVLLNENESFGIKYKELKQNYDAGLQEKRSQIQLLKQKNDELESEASKYQSALGIATNLDLSDDQNHDVKLNNDILELHDTLENYVTNLKPKINVNVNEAKKLLRQYGCQTKISDKEPNKPLIKAVLQHHVLKEILDQANFYFSRSNNKECDLESEIVYETGVLTGLMNRFYNNRLGDDEITRLTPIKLRQQVCTALGTRGFNDFKKSDSEYCKHDFISVISKTINGMMNKYRVIKDAEKKRYVNTLAEDLVRNVVKIFYFHLHIQEPIVQYHWFNNNEKINRSYMKGSWDEDEIENMVVEVCSFPLIFKPSVSGDVKICTPAKVFSRHYTSPGLLANLGNLGRKIKNLLDSSSDSTDEYGFEH